MVLHENPVLFTRVYWWRERKLLEKSVEEVQGVVEKYRKASRLERLYYTLNILSNVKRDCLISENLLQFRRCQRDQNSYRNAMMETRERQ